MSDDVEKQMTKQKNFINKSVAVHGSKYNYDKVFYVGSQDKVLITCTVHNTDFFQTPSSHQQRRGCPLCKLVTIKIKCQKTTESFIQEANKVHKGIYTYQDTIYTGNDNKLEITCAVHKQNFWQSASSHLRGHGCPKCAKVYRRTQKEFIDECNEIHQKKYDYSEVEFTNVCTPVVIICKEQGHGPFTQSPNDHLQGSGCPKCGHRMYTSEEFINKAKEVHGDTYDYSKSEYVNLRTKLVIICKKQGHVPFTQSPIIHLQGSGCLKCSYGTYTTEQFITKAKEVHGDTFDYSKSNYVNNHTKLVIICKKQGHNEFMQSPNNHLAGTGCPKCWACPSCLLWRSHGKPCEYCKPPSQNKLFYKTQEMAVVNFLKANLPNNEFIHNKSVGSECTGGHLFPDVLFDCGFYNLIIEIDEHKHRGASYSCDEKRMYDIIAKLGVPCIFIRYNPDDKNSDKNVLLELTKKYLELTETDMVWNDLGFKCDYLFY